MGQALRGHRGLDSQARPGARQRGPSLVGPGHDDHRYCGFIGCNPGNDRVFVATGDSGQGITHGALAGILLKDLIVAGSSPWQETYDPSRKTAKGIVNYLSENVTALKNFAEYLLPGGLEFDGPASAGAGRDPAPRDPSGGRLPRQGRQAACPFRHLHASRLPRELELDGAVLGLPLPRLAVRAGRCGPQWSGDFAARGRQGAGGPATCMTPAFDCQELWITCLRGPLGCRGRCANAARLAIPCGRSGATHSGGPESRGTFYAGAGRHR